MRLLLVDRGALVRTFDGGLYVGEAVGVNGRMSRQPGR